VGAFLVCAGLAGSARGLLAAKPTQDFRRDEEVRASRRMQRAGDKRGSNNPRGFIEAVVSARCVGKGGKLTSHHTPKLKQERTTYLSGPDQGATSFAIPQKQGKFSAKQLPTASRHSLSGIPPRHASKSRHKYGNELCPRHAPGRLHERRDRRVCDSIRGTQR